MRDFLPFIVSGLATGSIYGLASVGLVLTYRTSGIFNFGYGALATSLHATVARIANVPAWQS
jgi:branched-subunit amino acid ABC-type transport system permease component